MFPKPLNGRVFTNHSHIKIVCRSGKVVHKVTELQFTYSLNVDSYSHVAFHFQKAFHKQYGKVTEILSKHVHS